MQVTLYAIQPVNPDTKLSDLKSRLTHEYLDQLIDSMRNESCIIGFPKMKLSSTLKLQSALESLGLKSLFDPRSADLSVLSAGRRAVPATAQGRFVGGFRQPSQHSNYFRYEDDARGYAIEQWDTGYKMHKLSPTRRRRRQASQQKQHRPIDREFVEFLDSLKLPSFGVDELRNSAGIRNPGLFADDVVHKVEMTLDERGTEAAAATSVILDRSGDYRRFVGDRPFLFFIRHDPTRIIWFWGTINRPTPFF